MSISKQKKCAIIRIDHEGSGAVSQGAFVGNSVLKQEKWSIRKE
jgi:hypothetical protein